MPSCVGVAKAGTRLGWCVKEEVDVGTVAGPYAELCREVASWCTREDVSFDSDRANWKQEREASEGWRQGGGVGDGGCRGMLTEAG